MADIPDWAQDTTDAVQPVEPVSADVPDWAQETGPKPVSKPFKDEDFSEYTKLLKSKGTTPEKLGSWLESKGYGKPTNAAEILTFHRRDPNAVPNNTYGNRDAPAPDGMAQPGTATDWLPDFIQAPIENAGLALGLIDSKSYYGLGNYGENARAPNTETSVSNPETPGWVDRFVRSAGETFNKAGSGINAAMLRGAADVADDDAIRAYGSQNNWSGEQIDAAIKQARLDRGREVTNKREQQSVRNNDEVRRDEGLGVDPVTGEAISSTLGSVSRGSADLLGALVGDVNPTYFRAPAVKGLQLLGEVAAPIVGRMLGQGGVQAGVNLTTQADEVSRGIRKDISPEEVALQAAMGAGFQGGAEVISKLSAPLAKWVVAKIREPNAFEKLKAEGFDPNDLPKGVSPKAALKAMKELKGIRDEANNFKPAPEPKPTDMFPTEESRAADAEEWAKSLDAPEPAPVAPEPVVEAAAPEPTLSKKEADALFKQGTGTPEKQNTKEWGKSLEEQAADFLASKKLPVDSTPSTKPLPKAANDADPVVMESVDAVPEPEPMASPTSVVSRLTNALAAASKVSEEQKGLYKAERAKRFAQITKAQEEGGGKAAYEKSLAAMSGELPKADFESVEGQFSPQEIGSLFDDISRSSMSPGSKLSAHGGLQRLLNGEGVQPKQLEHLADVFPPEFIKAALSNRTRIAKAGGLLGELWNVPKSLQSTADFSGPLRQGLGLIHRPEYWKSLGPMFKAAFSPKTSAKLEEGIKSHKNYDLAKEAGLSITTSGKLGVSEDMFRSHIAENIPVWGKVVQGSERSYVGFLNKLRFDTFNSMLDQAQRIGHDIKDPDIAKGIARYVNVMTGRGGLGKMESSVGALNNVFYSPGLISSRLQILAAPVQSVAGKGFIAELPKGMRNEALKSYAGIIGFNTAALSLAGFAGNSVGLNPLSSDFLKMKDGDTRLDFGGGLTQYIVAGARAFNRKSTSSGDNGTTRELKRDGDTPLDNDLTFVMNKMHPTLTLLLDQQRGTTSVGEPFEWQKGIIDRLTPMGFPDIAATLLEHGASPGVYYAILGLIGAGLSNYHSKSDDTVSLEDDDTSSIADTGASPDWANEGDNLNGNN